MISYQEALQIIIDLSGSFGVETIGLEHALGRVLDEKVVADRDYPPFNRATMDGYAFRFQDIESGIVEFTVVETIFAGQYSQTPLDSGMCYKIMTGAAVPPGADMVIQKEVVIDNGKSVFIQKDDYRQFQKISKQGEDIMQGSCILEPPVQITAAVITALASLGRSTVKVKKLPRVAVFTTGNEVVAVGEPVSAFQIRNSNQPMLKALLQQWGIQPFLCEHIPDDKIQIFEMLSKGLNGDIVIISGGVSAGDADYVPGVLESMGVEKLFHKVAIKPGKPFWCGRIPNGAVVFALPGNPFSSLVTFTLFVQTYLLHCWGIAPLELLQLPLYSDRLKNTNLDEFFPVAIQHAPLGIVPLSFNGSGDITAALHADGIAHHPRERELLSSQDLVAVKMFKK